MDGDDVRAVVSAVEQILGSTTPDFIVQALLDAGIDEVRDADEETFLRVVFETAGSVLSEAPLLDLVLRPADRPGGHPPRLVLPGAPGARPAAVIEDSMLSVQGFAASGGSAAEMIAVVVREAGEPARLATFPARLVGMARPGGIDPAFGVVKTYGVVPLSEVDLRPFADEGFDARILLCLAHELVGVGGRMHRQACAHVLGREQFGVPLATMQTIQHALADGHVDLVAARELLVGSTVSRDLVGAVAAKSYAATTTLRIARQAQQVTGALGFTWEYGLHAAVRRAQTLDYLLGPAERLNWWLGARLTATEEVALADVGF